MNCAAQKDFDIDSLSNYMQMVSKLKYNHPDSAIALFEIGIKRAKELNDLYNERIGNSNIGITHGMLGNYSLAMKYFDKTLEVAQRANEPSWIAGAHSNKGIVYKYLGDFDKSLDEYFTALTIYDSVNDTSGIAATYNNLGIIYDVTGELDKSLEYYLKSQEISEQMGKYDVALLSNMGILKQRMGDYEESLELLFAFLDSMTVAGKDASVASTHMNIGTTYIRMGQLDKAEYHSRKSLEMSTKLESYRSQTESCMNLAQIYEKRNNFEEAVKWRKRQLENANKTNSNEEISIAHGELARALMKIGAYENAYLHLDTHTVLRDSLFQSEKNNAYKQWQTRLDVFGKDQEIKSQELELELLNTRARSAAKLRLALAIALVMSLISVVLFYLRARFRKRANQLLTDKNKMIEAQKQEIEEINRELEKRMLRAQINPHFIYNSLNSIQHFITSDQKLNALKYLSKFSKLLRQALENSVSVNVPLVEEIQLLQTYLELESLRFDNSFSFTIDSDEEIDIYETEIPILLVQPFVENAVLHAFQNTNEGIAREKHLNINFTEDHHHIICSIRDNGIGRAAARKLKDASISNRPSRGISVTEQRLAILYPKESHHDAVKIIDLTDSDGQPNGTEVVIKIPKE